ncbi:MAG: iron donor protein CyaY [Neisseriaceae bacterium]|nr:iron donor protein CyaY [Neisseriaceae bacterium]
MTESEFLNYSDQLFAHIDNQIDDLDLDVDCQSSGNVLTLEIDDSGEQIIINRHTPNQELWIAAKSGGFHFSNQDGQWLATRDGAEFFAVLNQVLSTALNDAVVITPFTA